MKLTTTFILATVVAGCSSSSRDRPGSYEERQARIENERSERSARGHDRMYGPGKPAAVENDFDQDNDGIVDQDDDGIAQAGEVKTDGTSPDTNNAEPDNTEPDNTALNERDRDSASLTPLDQSNTASDVEITQMIRKKVVGDDGLSFNAKNVKIITVSGKVTLRGPVESPAESATIERSARDVPGVKRVDNQLEVK